MTRLGENVKYVLRILIAGDKEGKMGFCYQRDKEGDFPKEVSFDNVESVAAFCNHYMSRHETQLLLSPQFLGAWAQEILAQFIALVICE